MWQGDGCCCGSARTTLLGVLREHKDVHLEYLANNKGDVNEGSLKTRASCMQSWTHINW